MNHEEWQRQVTDLALLLGWQHLHVRRSRGRGGGWATTTNRIGWPDLFLWHPKHGFAAIELKVGKDRPRPDQLEVLGELASAGASTLVAYPRHIDALKRLFQGERMEVAV